MTTGRLDFGDLLETLGADKLNEVGESAVPSAKSKSRSAERAASPCRELNIVGISVRAPRHW